MTTRHALRTAREEDAEEISEVILAALRETNAKDYPREVIDRVEKSFSPAAIRILMGERHVLVAQEGVRIVGTASLAGNAVRSVFVAPQAQGQGVGRRLMAAIEQSALDAGLTALVVSSSVSAQNFYAKLGYKALYDSYHGDERTIVMERRLMPLL